MELTYEIVWLPGATDVLIRDFIAANDDDFYPPIATRRNLDEFVQLVYDHKGCFIVCRDADRIVGINSIYLDHPSFITYYLYVAIDKAYRGKGISNTLYEMMHELCRERGVQWAIVKTWSENKVSQAMFKKHGFFHLYTVADDRSKGVHTYFFAKSFSKERFRQPVQRIGVTGSNSYALANIVHTLCNMPAMSDAVNTPVPVTAISGNAMSVPDDVSHLIILDKGAGIKTNAEVIDIGGITKRLVEERKKDFLLIASSDAADSLSAGNVRRPDAQTQVRINEIITALSTGQVLPSYYKDEITNMARRVGCTAVLLGMPALHTMFGFDKVYNGVEVCDPWLELAIIIQHNRMSFVNK